MDRDPIEGRRVASSSLVPPRSTDTSPATTPPRPSLSLTGTTTAVVMADRDKEMEDGALDLVTRALYVFSYPEGKAEEEQEAEAKDGPSKGPVQLRRSLDSNTAGSEAIKRARCSLAAECRTSVSSSSDHGSGLAALPGECLREVASFLGPSDLWPAFALVAKRISCRPAVVPLLLEACPRDRLASAFFGLVAASATAAADVQMLDLSTLPLGEAGGQQLARTVSDGAGLPSLRSLDVSASGLHSPALQALMGLRSLHSLRLSGNNLGDAGLAGLAQALQGGACPRLQVLVLANTAITDTGIAALAHALRLGCCPGLRRLDLSDNEGLGAAGAVQLMESLCGGGGKIELEELTLRDCALGSKGAAAVGAALASRALRGLVSMDLKGCGIGVEGMAALAEGWTLGQRPRRRLATATATAMTTATATATGSLRHLALGRNALGDAGARLLGAALSHEGGALRGLEALSVPDNGIGADGAEALWGGVDAGALTKLAAVDASRNPAMGVAGARGLARCLSRRLLTGIVDLDVSDTGLGPEGLASLAAALTSTSTRAAAAAAAAAAAPVLQRLILRDNRIGDGGVAALAEAVEAGGCEALHVLDLAGCYVGSDGLCALARACRSHARGLQTLDLSRSQAQAQAGGTGIGALGAYWLAAFLGEGALPRLQTLRIRGQDIGRSGLYMLHVAVRNGALAELSTLDLDDCRGLGDAGVGYLAIALQRGGCPRLEALRLAGSGLGDKGLRHLARALAARPGAAQARLTTLVLARNAALTGDGLYPLIDAVVAGALPRLERLDLDGCLRLGDYGIRAIVDAAHAGALDGLRALRVGGIGLTDEGLASWVQALLGNSNSNSGGGGGGGQHRPLPLQLLNLNGNHLTALGAEALGTLLGSNLCRNLEALRLAGNGIDDAGAEQLARALAASKRCPLLQELDLEENRAMGERGARALTTALVVDGAAPLCRLKVGCAGEEATETI